MNLKKIITENNRVTYQFDYSDKLREYFNPKEEFFIEYDGIDISNIPDSILVIPFLCNVLPIAWLMDDTIYVQEIDKEYYESIPEFKEGYINMYPQFNFGGKVVADKIVNNSRNTETVQNLAFFSGGVDAFNTLVNHINEKPVLITLWGSDVFFDDIEGWHNVKNHVVKTAELFSLEYKFIKSNFRKFINESTLSKMVLERGSYYGWWGGFHHGIGLIGHSAPLAYIYNSKTVYIASSFSVKDSEKFAWASDPTIDNFVRLGGRGNTHVIHDGYEFSRQDKIRNICDFFQKHSDVK